MRLTDFDAMVRRLSDDVPPQFFQGIAEITVSPRAVPHPTRAEVYTLGECIPLPAGQGSEVNDIQSRIVLYYGSFAALAERKGGFDWRGEAWETLTHELRHHLEWRARAPQLEAFDRAAEHNFARLEGEAFDPLFYLDGERTDPAVYRIEEDYFLDRVVRTRPPEVTFQWHGARYRVEVPAEAELPCFLSIEGLAEPPPGELVLVLRGRPGIWRLFRAGPPFQASVTAEPLDA